MKTLVLFCLLIVCPTISSAFPGEVFKIETVGTEYCGDFVSFKFGANNNVDLWARLDNDTQLTVSLTPTFIPGTTFPMSGYFYFSKSTTAAFVGAGFYPDGSYATIRGTAAVNKKTGAVTALSGVFIANSVFEEGCFSSGNFTSKPVSK